MHDALKKNSTQAQLETLPHVSPSSSPPPPTSPGVRFSALGGRGSPQTHPAALSLVDTRLLPLEIKGFYLLHPSGLSMPKKSLRKGWMKSWRELSLPSWPCSLIPPGGRWLTRPPRRPASLSTSHHPQIRMMPCWFGFKTVFSGWLYSRWTEKFKEV